MLRVALHCGVSRHQFAMGKDLGRPAMPTRETLFPGAYDMSNGVYWMHVCLVAMNVSTSVDVLLLSLWRRGLKPQKVSQALILP